MPGKYRTKTDLRNIKKIAETFAETELDSLPQIERYLNSYIHSNESSKDAEKIKKVEAAKILLPFFKQNGRLQSIKNNMGNLPADVDSELERLKDKPELLDAMEEENLGIVGSINSLRGVVVGDKDYDIPQIEEALTTFMESDNFAEYHSDSPLRKMVKPMKMCVEAHYAMDQLKTGVDQINYLETEPENYMKNAWDEHSRKFTEPLFAAYGDNLSLTFAENELKKLTGLGTIQKEIDSLRDEYAKALQEEKTASAAKNEYDSQIVELRKAYEKESASAVKGERQKWSQNEKRTYGNALAQLANAYDKVIEARQKDPNAFYNPFEEAQRDNAAYEKAQRDLEETKRRFDTDVFLEGMFGAEEQGKKEALKYTVGKYMDEYALSLQEEQKWMEIYSSYTTYMNNFGDDPVIMDFLISNDPDKELAGLRKLEKDYNIKDDPAKKQLYDFAVSCRSRINELPEKDRNELFSYDGKEDLQSFMQKLGERLMDKTTRARSDFEKDNQVKRAYEGYKNTKDALAKYTKQLQDEAGKGDQANAETITDLNKKMQEQMEKNSEYIMRLNQIGIMDPDVIRQAGTFTETKVREESSAISAAQSKAEAARKKANESRQFADKVKNAIDTAKKSPLIMEYKQIAGFMDMLQTNSKDEKMIPTSKQPFEDAYHQKNVIIKQESSRVAQELNAKLADLEKKKAQADKILGEKKSEMLLDKLTQKALEQKKVARRYEALNKQDVRMKDLVTKTKQFMEPKYKIFYDEYEKIPKGKTAESYSRIYKELQKFQQDFSKCMRDDYARDPNGKNSPEYKQIKAALDAFGAEKDFNKLSVEQLKGKLSNLKTAATEYKRLKLKEKRLVWSHQRRYRLDYADRISKFAEQEMLVNLPVLEDSKDAQSTQRMEEAYKEYEKRDPNGMMMKAGGGQKKKDDKTVINGLRLRTKPSRIREIEAAVENKEKAIDEKMEDAVRELNTRNGLKEEDLARLLFKLDTLQQMKEKLKDPDLLSKNGVEKHLSDIGKQLKDKNLNEYVDAKIKSIETDRYRQMARMMDKNMVTNLMSPEELIGLRDVTVMRQEQKKLGQDRSKYFEQVKTNQIRSEVENNRKADSQKRREKIKSGEDSKGLANEILENKDMKTVKKRKPAKAQQL